MANKKAKEFLKNTAIQIAKDNHLSKTQLLEMGSYNVQGKIFLQNTILYRNMQVIIKK